MKLAVGQRWLRLNDDGIARYKLVEIIQYDSAFGYDSAKCRILSTDNAARYPADSVDDYCAFPLGDGIISNRYWEYLVGQDRP
jgi:hypothetical protein